ncbi:MAG: adenylyltransferase/cytidyltransferase family protein [Minisyncoccia bacterium]
MKTSRNGINEHKMPKIVHDYKKLALAVSGLQAVNRVVVATIGSWDLLHIGHLRYLIKAKSFGDVLVVGVDSDRGIKSYKGDLRPVVPQGERCEMLTYQSAVDFVTLVDDINKNGQWQYKLIKVIRPDVFVAVKGSYPREQIANIRKYCKKVVILPRQAEKTSTSNFIQNTVKKHLKHLDKIRKENGK